MGDDWQRSTDETNAQVDSALDSMGAPQYTPPEPGDSSFTTRADAPGSMEFRTPHPDGSLTEEVIRPGLDYSEHTEYPDGSRTFHNVGPEESVSGSTTNWPGSGFPAQHHEDSYNYQRG